MCRKYCNEFSTHHRITSQVFGRLAPAMKGIGYAMLATTVFAAIEYVVIIAWSMHYFFNSITSKLPWSDCGNRFNSPFCTPPGFNKTCNSAEKAQCISAPGTLFSDIVKLRPGCIM